MKRPQMTYHVHDGCRLLEIEMKKFAVGFGICQFNNIKIYNIII